jgi:selenocysteine lyase/cysteine desulfurase
MAAPSLVFFPPSEALSTPQELAAEASLQRVRAAANIARDRIAEIEGVRVIGPEVKSASSSVRLAIDLRDTGRDAWNVACELAGRGFTLDNASHRVIVVRLTEEDVKDATHHRLAPALQLALWATPAGGRAE